MWSIPLKKTAQKKLFNVKNEFSKHEIIDQVKFEYKCYQVESLLHGFYELPADKNENVNCNSRPSYWREAYSLLNTTSQNLKAIIVELMSTGGIS